MISSTDGLVILKNWQSAGITLLLASVTLRGNGQLFETRVRVQSVNELLLVFINLDSPSETESVDFVGANVSVMESISGVEVMFADGKKAILREDQPCPEPN